jgi:hypothetical protein
MTRRNNDSRLVHHTLQASDLGAAVTTVGLQMGNLNTAATNTVNPGFPSAARLRRIFVHSGCLVVNVAGDWTLRMRVQESGSDTATFTIGMAALPGSKNTGQMSAAVVLQAGQTYHMVADGPSRNIAILRVMLEWEVL